MMYFWVGGYYTTKFNRGRPNEWTYRQYPALVHYLDNKQL